MENAKTRKPFQTICASSDIGHNHNVSRYRDMILLLGLQMNLEREGKFPHSGKAAAGGNRCQSAATSRQATPRH
jgi:hypothetical protein